MSDDREEMRRRLVALRERDEKSLCQTLGVVALPRKVQPSDGVEIVNIGGRTTHISGRIDRTRGEMKPGDTVVHDEAVKPGADFTVWDIAPQFKTDGDAFEFSYEDEAAKLDELRTCCRELFADPCEATIVMTRLIGEWRGFLKWPDDEAAKAEGK